jgi:hypothetical protein
MPKKLTHQKLSGNIAKAEKGKSQSKVGDISQTLKIIKQMIKKETIDYKLGKRKSMPIAKMLFSYADKALKGK